MEINGLNGPAMGVGKGVSGFETIPAELSVTRREEYHEVSPSLIESS
jgi:hypothetical protein